MDEGEYTVRKVEPSDVDEEKDIVFLDSGMSGFLADKGKFEEGDVVEVEEYEDYRGETSYRVVD